ncbi:MAG: oligosaccharide flippase family protein [Vampirovibrionales bacterium]|nr:oligosaccharide flippase family protein [Vampirovibrionales bacterium]
MSAQPETMTRHTTRWRGRLTAVRRNMTDARALNWTLLDQGLVSGVNFLTGIVLARCLGLEAFGRFSAVWLAISLAATLQMAMILAPMMSIGPQQNADDEPAYYGAALLQQLIAALIGFILLGLGAEALGRYAPQWGLTGLGLPIALTLVTCQLQEFLRRYFFTLRRYQAAFINDVLSYGSQAALLGAWIFAPQAFGGPSLEAALWIIAATSGLAAAVGLASLTPMKIEEEFFWPAFRRNWRSARWLSGSAVLQWMSGSTLILAAGWWLGPAAVGALKAAQNIVGVAHILFNAFSNFIPVRLASLLRHRGAAAMSISLRRTTLLGAVGTLALLAPAIVAPNALMTLFYGADFGQYAGVVIGFALTYGLAFFAQQLTFALRAMEEARPIFLGYLVTAAASVALAWPLIHLMGLNGVAVGLVLLAGLNLATLWAGYRRARQAYLTKRQDMA